MSTSRCNVRVIANGTSSGHRGDGEGREKGRAKTGTTIGTMRVRHRELGVPPIEKKTPPLQEARTYSRNTIPMPTINEPPLQSLYRLETGHV